MFEILALTLLTSVTMGQVQDKSFRENFECNIQFLPS